MGKHRLMTDKAHIVTIEEQRRLGLGAVRKGTQQDRERKLNTIRNVLKF